MSVVGIEDTPIYLHKLPSTSWALLWWLICKMDEDCAVHGGWRAAAARDLSKDRIWMQKCAQELRESGLIECEPRQRYAKVLISRITG
jgi:hypothetical protein